MNKLEPTYLRYVYDGLNKGSLNAENAAALPRGLIGLYEQEFTQKTPAGERKKVLNKLALWALFKGPVSTNFAADVIEIEEQQMKDLVDTYSSWFNSPESGKYLLYHERLRVYLLQKLKSAEIELLNNKIINILKKALEKKTEDNLNLYGLQFLGYHQLIETALNKSFEDFINTCLENKFIDRQIDISNAFNWSKEPIKEALKLAAFNENKNIVFELSKSLVNLNTKEKEGLGEIQNLLDDGKDELVITRLNSILDGTKENYTTSYAFQILSIAYLMDTHSSNDIEKRVGLFIDNIENNIPDDQKIVDQFLLIPEHITIKLLVELKNNGLEPDFTLKRCSSINFSSQNLSTYNVKELKYLHELCRTYYHDDEIDFLVCAATRVINKNNKSDYFYKKIENLLEKNRKQEKSFSLVSGYGFRGFDLIPEEIINKTKNRIIINYCCKNYLSYGTNKFPLKFYKEKFKIKENDDIKVFFPFPEIKLTKLFELDELQEISKKLANKFDKKSNQINDHNKKIQIRIISSLVNEYGYELNQLQKLIEQYDLINDLSFYNDLFEDYLISSLNEEWCLKILDANHDSEDVKENFGGSKIYWLTLQCHIFINKLYKGQLKEEDFIKEFVSNLILIEEINNRLGEKYHNFEVIYLIKKIIKYEFHYFIIKKIKDKLTNPYNVKEIVELYLNIFFKRSDFENFDRLYNSKYILPARISSLPIVACIPTDLYKSNKQINFILNKLVNINEGSDQNKYNVVTCLVDILVKSQSFKEINTNELEKLILEKLSEFNTSLWRYLAIKYFCEKSKIETKQIFKLLQKYGLKKSKVKSDDLNSFRLQFKLPEYETITSKTMKRKMALHCIKNNFSDYFISNELHKERLFSEFQLIKFSSNYLNHNNIDIFNCLIDSIEDIYNQLAIKNELYYFINSKSLKTSKISFDYDEDRVSVQMAIKAIKCTGDVNSLEILNECVKELDDIEDDEIDLETGEFIDGNEEKVKSLYFIITNLWKIGEKKLARKQLKLAFDLHKKMEFPTSKEDWIKKLDHLAITVLTKKDLEFHLSEKVQNQELLGTIDIIDSIFKNNFSSIINEIFTKDNIDRSVMRYMVNAYVKYHSLEKAFTFVNQINNQVHAKAWRNIVLEKVYSIGNDFDSTVAFDKYDLVYNSVESTKALEQMLKYELFSDLSSESSIKQITSKYDGYLIESEVKQLVKNISNA